MTDPLKKFGPVWGASGVQGFFGEGYPYHRYFKYLGLNLKGLTLTAKTSTIGKNEGNMPLEEDGITPKEFSPRCIYVSPRSWAHGSALNAVALSGPGFQSLIEKKEWQKMIRPFFISIMAIGETEHDRRIEMWMFADKLGKLLIRYPHLQDFIGLQINYSCPNTGHNMEELLAQLVEEVKEHFSVFRSLGIPIVPKINLLLPLEKALEIGNDRVCAGLTLSNTIPWDDLPRFGINRKEIFGSDVSPLIKRGFKQAGGYSGKELLPIVGGYVMALRAAGFTKHINAGGGILNPHGIDLLHESGADSFSLGSIAFLRPWETGPTIRRAYQVKGVPFPF